MGAMRGGVHTAIHTFGRSAGEISEKYLEQIVPILNKNDMLQTNRGYQGGYRLVKEPYEYTVGEILRATEGGLAPVNCVGINPVDCNRKNDCDTTHIWEGLEKVINEYLDGITLQDILDKRKREYILDFNI